MAHACCVPAAICTALAPVPRSTGVLCTVQKPLARLSPCMFRRTVIDARLGDSCSRKSRIFVCPDSPLDREYVSNRAVLLSELWQRSLLAQLKEDRKTDNQKQTRGDQHWRRISYGPQISFHAHLAS